MPDETISTAWTNQSNTQNLESGGGPSSLGNSDAGLQGGGLFQSFDLKYGGAGAVFPGSGSLIGSLMSASDPFTSKGVAVDVTGAGTAVTLLCAALINGTTGGLVAVTGDYHSTIATGYFPMYWSGDTDSNAVGLRFGPGKYYVAVGALATTTEPSFLALSAANVNLNTAVPTGSAPFSNVLRNAVLTTGLTAATPPSAAVDLTAESANTSVIWTQVI